MRFLKQVTNVEIRKKIINWKKDISSFTQPVKVLLTDCQLRFLDRATQYSITLIRGERELTGDNVSDQP